MVDRLILNSAGLKVSKPGINVNGAGPTQLSFDSSKVISIWHSALLARPGDNSSTWIINYSYPALPFKPCYSFQIYSNGQWRQGFDAGVFGAVVNQVTTNSYTVTWLTNVEGGGIQYVRICIYNIRGE